MTEDERGVRYASQIELLGLRPWQTPPCYLDAEVPPSTDWDRQAWKLLRAMLKAGISRWHPDPLVALASASREKKL